MRIYAVQHDIVWEDKQANFERVASMLEKAAPLPGSLIVLPEMFATGFSKNLPKTIEGKGGETEMFLKRMALLYQCCVMGGLVTNGDDKKGRNEALAISPDGQELARYTKIQTFTADGEHLVHEAGERVMTFQYGGFTIAPLICYDLRFPELARDAVKQGAELLIYIASWPISRAQHWLTLLQARAIENQAWVIGSNRSGRDPSLIYPGRSLVVDPFGLIITDAANRESVLEACIDVEVSRVWRSQFPALRDMNRN